MDALQAVLGAALAALIDCSRMPWKRKNEIKYDLLQTSIIKFFGRLSRIVHGYNETKKIGRHHNLVHC